MYFIQMQVQHLDQDVKDLKTLGKKILQQKKNNPFHVSNLPDSK